MLFTPIKTYLAFSHHVAMLHCKGRQIPTLTSVFISLFYFRVPPPPSTEHSSITCERENTNVRASNRDLTQERKRECVFLKIDLILLE